MGMSTVGRLPASNGAMRGISYRRGRSPLADYSRAILQATAAGVRQSNSKFKTGFRGSGEPDDHVLDGHFLAAFLDRSAGLRPPALVSCQHSQIVENAQYLIGLKGEGQAFGSERSIAVNDMEVQ